MKRLIVCVLIFGVLSATAQSRKKIDFDNNWKFALGHAADASKDFNYSISNIFAKSGKNAAKNNLHFLPTTDFIRRKKLIALTGL